MSDRRKNWSPPVPFSTGIGGYTQNEWGNPYKSTKLCWQYLIIFMFLRWPLYFKFLLLKHLLFYLYNLDSYFACDWVKPHLQRWVICVDFVLKVLFPAFTETWVGVCGDGFCSCGCPMVPSSGSYECKQLHHTYQDHHSPQLLLCNTLGRTQKLKQAVWRSSLSPKLAYFVAFQSALLHVD